MAELQEGKALRKQLAELVGDWQQAHLTFDAAVKSVPPRLRGVVPQGFVHSIWQIVEHMRIAQADILDFCVNPRYKHGMTWPDDYWPKTPAPKSATAWTRSIADIKRDRTAVQKLALNPKVDLFATIPWGSGQTYLREVLLVADHAAYHTSQIIDVRRALGIWK